jgi:hypothetical protein
MERPPTSITVVIDTTTQSTLVELPTEIEGQLATVKATAWYINPIVAPFVQVKFGEGGSGIKVTPYVHGASLRGDCIQLPLPGANTVITTPNQVLISHNRKLPRVFTMQLYNSAGLALTPNRFTLWLEIYMSP